MRTTISDQARSLIAGFAPLTEMPNTPKVDDLAGWDAQNAQFIAGIEPKNQAALASYPVSCRDIERGGVKVLEVTPRQMVSQKKILIHLHGGCYTFFSARSCLCAAAPVACEAGLRVYSIDYTLAPRARWRDIYREIESVLQALLAEGRTASDIAIYGESAGGALAAGTALMMMETGLGTPAALVLLSPWSDIDNTGESYSTQADVEVAYDYDRHCRNCALAYAEPGEFREPWVSPVYANYPIDYPPTLIQGGTREIFLSNFIRHYQVLDQANVKCQLDLYEGLPHAFWALGPDVPESIIARHKAVKYLAHHLDVIPAVQSQSMQTPGRQE